MTQVAYRSRDAFLQISQPAVFSNRPSATSRVASSEPWLERPCRLDACSKLKNPIPRTVPVKMIDRNNVTTRDSVRSVQKNAKSTFGKSQNSPQTRCANSTLVKSQNSPITRCANSEFEPWKCGRALDVLGRTFNLSAKKNVIVQSFAAKNKAFGEAKGTQVKPVPKSKSEYKFHTEKESPCYGQLRYSDSRLTIKTSKRSEKQIVKSNQIPSEGYRDSPPSNDSASGKNKPISKAAFGPQSKSRAETSYAQLQTEANYLRKSCAPSAIRGLEKKVNHSTFWKPEKGRVQRPYHSAKPSLNSARKKHCCSPVSNICGRDDYSLPIQFRQDDQTDVECFTVGQVEPKHLRSFREPLSSTMLSVHARREGPWASAVNKTHYILQWLADVEPEGED